MVVTDIVYQGGGMLITFSDNSVATALLKVVNNQLIYVGLSQEQQDALEVFNANNVSDQIGQDDIRIGATPAQAEQIAEQIEDVTAAGVGVDASAFSSNLSNADDDVQKALETLDQLVAGGSGGKLYFPALSVEAPAEIGGNGGYIYAQVNEGSVAGDNFSVQLWNEKVASSDLRLIGMVFEYA